VANTLKSYRNGAVGFIDWLDSYEATVGFGFICQLHSWDVHRLQAAIEYRAQEMP
jgi:hypothetical protein